MTKGQTCVDACCAPFLFSVSFLSTTRKMDNSYCKHRFSFSLPLSPGNITSLWWKRMSISKRTWKFFRNFVTKGAKMLRGVGWVESPTIEVVNTLFSRLIKLIFRFFVETRKRVVRKFQFVLWSYLVCSLEKIELYGLVMVGSTNTGYVSFTNHINRICYRIL